jgi:hypothetical protein
MVYLLKMVIFHGDVKQPDGIYCNTSKPKIIWQYLQYLLYLQYLAFRHHTQSDAVCPKSAGLAAAQFSSFLAQRLGQNHLVPKDLLQSRPRLHVLPSGR